MTIPFLQFGVLANPRGQKEFRDTLHELFGRAADASAPGDDERELIIITQPVAVRQAVARHRYDNAVDALRLMHNYPTSFEFRKRTLDDNEYLANGEVNHSSLSIRFLRAIKHFNRRIRLPDQERMYELAAAQLRSEADVGNARDDRAFSKTLKTDVTSEEHGKGRRFSDQYLFRRLAYPRIRLGETMAWQEGNCAFPENVPCLKLDDVGDEPDEFENTLTLFLDGEIIICKSNLKELRARINRISSSTVITELLDFRDKLSSIFSALSFERSKQVLDKFDRVVEEAHNASAIRRSTKQPAKPDDMEPNI